jgi:hypothetical protein
MRRMAGRKRHSAEDIVRKLRRADVDRPRFVDETVGYDENTDAFVIRTAQ